MILWADFKAAVESAGLKARECSAGHWQAIGRERVNVWPTARGGQKMHVCGSTAKARRFRSLFDVIEAAGGPETPQQEADRIAQNMLAEFCGESPAGMPASRFEIRDGLAITAIVLSLGALAFSLLAFFKAWE